MKRLSLAFVLILAASTAQAWDRTGPLLARAWPAAPYADLANIGAGVGIIFSPDLSVPGNCRFYEALGFQCFDSPDWLKVLAEIHEHNTNFPGRRIRTLILETHGTNGHGLKLQEGKKATDDRSYISVGALQEWLEPVGVRYIILSACNSGRLLRPEIYLKLNRNPGDPLFLPASFGIIDATDDFDPARAKSVVITPVASHIENTLVGSVKELAAPTRRLLKEAAALRSVKLPAQFAVSEMLIAMMTRDPELKLRSGDWVEEKSDVQTSVEVSEHFFQEFVDHLNTIAARDAGVQSASAAGSR